MAIMTDAQRYDAWAEFMRDIPPGRLYAISKSDLRAAINATDQYINDTAVTYNNALPQPARGALTIEEKARLHTVVVKYRYLGGV
jgi:hypothetical protein